MTLSKPKVDASARAIRRGTLALPPLPPITNSTSEPFAPTPLSTSRGAITGEDKLTTDLNGAVNVDGISVELALAERRVQPKKPISHALEKPEPALRV